MDGGRGYRDLVKASDLVKFEVKVKETDVLIGAATDLSKEAEISIRKYRKQLEDYINLDPMFKTTFSPHLVSSKAPEIVCLMAGAAIKAGVGPMAAVAGAIAECVGKELLGYSDEIIVENGGDLFIKSKKLRTVGIYAGESPFSYNLGIEVLPEETPLGICTSSGTVGHSISLGKADAVVVVSGSAALADAAATAVGNVVKSNQDIAEGIEKAKGIEGVRGVIIIKGEKMGIWGKLKLLKI